MNKKSRNLRHHRIRQRISGTTARPRACAWRTLNRVAVQIVDDTKGTTLVAVYGDPKGKGTKTEQAKVVGAEVAKQAKAAGITSIVFDRGGYQYHGRIKALAEAMRAGGLEF